MGNVKDWVRMLFRPKMERKLFNLLRMASSKQLSLDSVLIDKTSSNEIKDDQFYKLSVDAFVFGVISDTYDVSLTARKVVYHDCKNDCKYEPKCNVTVGEYVKNLADLVLENKLLTYQDVNNLMRGSHLLQDIWNDAQKIGRKLYGALSDEYNLTDDDLYAYGYPVFSIQKMYLFETRVASLLNLSFERPKEIAIKNISSVVAYHLSRAIA